MKAGYYVWIDQENRKVRRSMEYEMVEEFDTRYGDRPYPHKWNEELFEFQDGEKAKNFQVRLATELAGDPRFNMMARNTNLFKPRGPLVGDF